MLRKRAYTTLQKTYDDSYLSCSTAVYYEGQGHELEALRYWKHALDLICEHHITKIQPGYGPQTDGEKALVDALRELELQCRERINLLEALRASREDGAASTSDGKPSMLRGSQDAASHLQGSIGQGSIPAVTYSELSRLSVPLQRSAPTRTPPETPAPAGGSSDVEPIAPTSPQSTPISPASVSRSEKRPSSQDKHTMRTTLRSGKTDEKLSSKFSRKSTKSTAEGPSKAATLAWLALGSRERLLKISSSDNKSSPSTPSARRSFDQLPKPGTSQLQWDSHSRRLVAPPRNTESGSTAPQPQSAPRRSDEFPYSRPSHLSVSAASSALNSSTNLEYSSADQNSGSSKQERVLASRTPPISGSPSRPSKGEQFTGRGTSNNDAAVALGNKKNTGDAPVRRKAVARRPVQPSLASSAAPGHREKSSKPRSREPQNSQQISESSTNEDDAGKSTGKARANKRKETVAKPCPEELPGEEPLGNEGSGDTVWKERKAFILKNLPPGVDEMAAKQILNDIVVQGDEVHWGDIAGLEIAKNALRETVVYPFLRPDLFMGLREPARGMLLFGPPGTGKTMLARAVATESKSTFFSISASSLTSKYLGESEKLVRALFGLARMLAPSIIFVDEIDSLLSQRSGSGEHEATRRIKTEFLIQWSNLQRAAAGREASELDKDGGDANRVLVLAATNLPWEIDEAARRRFVRRQYIPLPEAKTRDTQLRTLLGQQKHSLSSADIARLVELTEGFSGSDITALAKDAAMGPLRSLGEALLHMTMDEIRPIQLIDFETSLGTIRPSVSQAGLKEYEDWAKEFGERGG